MVKTTRKNSRGLKSRKTRMRKVRSSTSAKTYKVRRFNTQGMSAAKTYKVRRSASSKTYKVRRSASAKRLTRKGGYTKWQVKTQTLGIGSLRKSKLTQFGYHTNLSKTERAAAISKAIKEYGALSVYRSLNALAVYNKNTHPEVAKHAKEDRDMIRAKFF
jgi:hypothetical protein